MNYDLIERRDESPTYQESYSFEADSNESALEIYNQMCKEQRFSWSILTLMCGNEKLKCNVNSPWY